MFTLGDDGTLDTVIVCDQCGEEMRFNFEPDSDPDSDYTYDDFVEWCKLECDDFHVCPKEDA